MPQESPEDAVVPFEFACRRSGNCCSVPGGYVWLEPGDLERLAARLGLSEREVLVRYVRRVPDPATGGEREALVDGEGERCVFLEGRNRCTVYEDRPDHCRRFPFWESVLTDRAAFERARATCPGIRVPVEADARRRAFDALEALYREVDAFVERSDSVCILRGRCCRFEEADHLLYATGLETEYAADRHPTAPPPEAEGRCPYHVAGRCTAREGRPLGCRTYFCDRRTSAVLEEAHEHFLARIRAIEAEAGFAPAYAPFPAAVRARIETRSEGGAP